MRAAFYFAPILFLLSSCAATGKHDLPTFSYNKHLRNALIVNRYPHYGDGQPDGCIREAQFALALHAVAGGDSIAGVVTDVQTRQPVFYAATTLFLASTLATTLVAVSPTGGFTFSRAQRVQRITISAIGYRSLTVEIQPLLN